LAKYAELARPLRVKISGCPTDVRITQSPTSASYAAALSKARPDVPPLCDLWGGRARGDDAQFGALIGKFPAKKLR